MQSHIRTALLLCALLITSQHSANAAFIRNSFGLDSPARTITFEEHFFPKYTFLRDEYEDLGLRFEPFLIYNSVLTHLPNNDDELETQLTMISNISVGIHNDPFSIEFTEPQAAAAFILQSNTGVVRFEALLDGEVIESATAEIGRGISIFENFFGFKDIVFDEIRVSQTAIDFGSPGVVMDRFELLPASSLPEPAALAVLVCLLPLLFTRRRALLGLTLPLLLLGTAHASPYTLTKIAESSPNSEILGTVELNNLGQIAYTAFTDRGTSIFLSNGNQTRQILNSRDADLDTISAPALNDIGQVAFIAGPTDGGLAIMRSDGDSSGSGPLIETIVHSDGPLGDFFTFPSINNLGQVTFQSRFDAKLAYGLFLGDGDTLQTLMEMPARYGPPNSPPTVNDSGHVAFESALDDGIRRIVLSKDGAATPIATSGVGEILGVSDAIINATDQIAYHARLNTDFDESILLYDSGQTREIIRTGGDINALFAHDLNDAGAVVFQAGLESTNPFEGGIFLADGSGAILPILRTGDALDGSIVAGLSAPVINNAGQIAFLAYLQDQRAIIVRADPVPEPTTLGTLALLSITMLLRKRVLWCRL